MSEQDAAGLLEAFPRQHVTALVRHFVGAERDFKAGEWEEAIAKSGKFTEAVLKALYVASGNAVATGRSFKVDQVINGLANIPTGTQHDTIRLLIPRACRFVYDIASNRGGRHDPDEVDPNAMDATVVMATCSWIFAEMIRYSQRGRLDHQQAKDVVASLTQKLYPLVETVDGRVYFHSSKKSAFDVVLLALADGHPNRMSKQELMGVARRHGFKPDNARKAVERLMKFVDADSNGRLRLLATGLRKADDVWADMLAQAAAMTKSRSRRRK